MSKALRTTQDSAAEGSVSKKTSPAPDRVSSEEQTETLLAWFARHECLTAFLLGVLAMAWVQSSSYEPSGIDSLYHIKMSVLLPQIGFPDKFHWLRHSILNENNVSHHTGFHMMLVPFVYASKWTARIVPERLANWANKGDVGNVRRTIADWLREPDIFGAKVFSSLMFGVMSVVVLLLLRELQVGSRWFWMVALFALPWDFYLRMSYIRAPIVSLTIMLLVCYCCLARRPIWAGLLGFLSCHIYLGALVFYPIVVLIFVGAELVLRRSLRDGAPILAAAAIGVVLGFLTHPFFPESVEFLKVQILRSGLQVEEVNKVGVGTEWKGYEPDRLVQNAAFILALTGLSLTLRLNRHRICQPGVLAFLCLNLFFLGMCLRHQRFVEYWPVFALLSSSAFWAGSDSEATRFLNRVSLDSETFGDLIKYLFSRFYIGIIVFTIAVGGFSLSQARRVARSRFDHVSIRRAMDFLRENSAEGSLVLADDWDVFPLYFYYNHHNDYVCGLDPQFTNSLDPELWERYCVITQGRAPHMSEVKIPLAKGADKYKDKKFKVELSDIYEHFGADYVVVDADHSRFYQQLKRDNHYDWIYPPANATASKQPAITIFKVNRDSQLDDVSRGTALHNTREIR